MVQLDQHSSPSKYTKPTVEHSALARVETQHSRILFYTYARRNIYICVYFKLLL